MSLHKYAFCLLLTELFLILVLFNLSISYFVNAVSVSEHFQKFEAIGQLPNYFIGTSRKPLENGILFFC